MAVRTGLIAQAPSRPNEATRLRSDLEDAMVGNDEITRAKLELFMKHMRIK